jgi:organic hydroperoxide reductase OsmC/OhrA
VEATLEKGEGGYSVSKAFVQPLLTISPGADQERGMRLLEKAERACLISRSVKTQIELRLGISIAERELAPAPTA